MTKLFLSILLMTAITQKSIAQEDPYLWLEEVDGKKAMEFVNEQNKKTFDKISQQKEYSGDYTKEHQNAIKKF